MNENTPKKGYEIIGAFNNEKRDDVKNIKQTAAELVDMINDYGKNKRHNAIAVTHVETAAMFAVKSLFTPD